MSDMKIVYLDIETSPNLVYAWGLRLQNIAISQIVEPTRVLCAAWSWEDSDKMHFSAEWFDGGRENMLYRLYSVLEEADVVVHYNGASFDIPHLNREFLEAGLSPPAPYAQVDLYRAVKGLFRFPSNKLAYLSDVLALGDDGKLHTDMSLWNNVLEGNAKAQQEMQKYNEEDVILLKDLYVQLQPWIPSHPNAGLYARGDAPVCVSCGSPALEKRGYAYTGAGKFQRYTCTECGRWMRAATRLDTTPLREVR